jgi:hypothetical protein
MKLKLSLVIIISLLMTACATHSLNAPCDQDAHFCGSKTKINQW